MSKINTLPFPVATHTQEALKVWRLFGKQFVALQIAMHGFSLVKEPPGYCQELLTPYFCESEHSVCVSASKNICGLKSAEFFISSARCAYKKRCPFSQRLSGEAKGKPSWACFSIPLASSNKKKAAALAGAFTFISNVFFIPVLLKLRVL
ncbi:MAG: hypothetical protein ACOX6V_02680 [Patescibacteria group bacterium]|jgi:hypothetical protein